MKKGDVKRVTVTEQKGQQQEEERGEEGEGKEVEENCEGIYGKVQDEHAIMTEREQEERATTRSHLKDKI